MAAVPEAFEDKGAEDAFSVRERMASMISDIINVDGKCSPHELKNHGFMPDEIARHWPMAFALAQVSLNSKPKMNSQSPQPAGAHNAEKNQTARAFCTSP